jgi:hypothetical protein
MATDSSEDVFLAEKVVDSGFGQVCNNINGLILSFIEVLFFC